MKFKWNNTLIVLLGDLKELEQNKLRYIFISASKTFDFIIEKNNYKVFSKITKLEAYQYRQKSSMCLLKCELYNMIDQDLFGLSTRVTVSLPDKNDNKRRRARKDEDSLSLSAIRLNLSHLHSSFTKWCL